MAEQRDPWECRQRAQGLRYSKAVSLRAVVRQSVVSSAWIALFATACALPHATGRAGAEARDSSANADSAVLDEDAEAPMDAGVAQDTGVTVDSGVPIDSGIPVDTGLPIDTGIPIDTGVVVDSGFPCGALGQACCGPADVDSSCERGLTCIANACRRCGELNLPCCNGNCTTPGTTCSASTTPRICTRGVTSDCGDEGQICCIPSAAVPACKGRLICLGVCVAL